MPGRLTIGLLLISLGIQEPAVAQQPWLPMLQGEFLLYQNESAELPMEVYEAYADLQYRPLELNSASADQLAASGLFTSFQIHNLIKFRERFGSLYSIYELVGITGFRLSQIQEIAPYLSVNQMTRMPGAKGNRHMVMINLGQSVPKKSGYHSLPETGGTRAYSGSPLKTDIRIKSELGRSLSLGLTYEKDAGEPFINGIKPQFISGYLQYRGDRHLKQVVLGNFKLHHGLGLVNGTGFIHSPESLMVNRQSMSRLRAYSSKSETGYERGVGCVLDLKIIDLLIWASYLQMDLSLRSLPENPENINWVKYFRTSGLHRTMGEQAGQNLAYRIHSGVQALYKAKNMDVGLMLGLEATGLTGRGTDSLRSISNSKPGNSFSLHGNWRKDHLHIFGELAVDRWKSAAIFLGATCHFSDFVQGRIFLHQYGVNYRGLKPSAYSSGSSIENEQGFALCLHVEPGRLITADFTGELFNYPGPRYTCLVPSMGYRYSIVLKNTRTANLSWKFLWLKKSWQTTPGDGKIGVRSIQNSEVDRIDLQIGSHQRITWQSRFILSLYSQGSTPVPGYAAVQQIKLPASKVLKCVVQFVLFHVEDWENRIYLYEPGFYYGFSFPSYYGSGQKSTVVLTFKPLIKLTIAGKIALTSYHDRKSIGSGNDLIQGNQKWEIGMQIRLNL